MLFDFVGKKFWFFLGSAIIIIAGLISIFLPGGIKWGIEFEGGNSVIVSRTALTLEELNQVLTDLGYADAMVESIEGGKFSVKLRELDADEQIELKNKLAEIDATVEDFSEFEGGNSVTVSRTTLALGELNQALADLGYGGAMVQSFGGGEFFIRLGKLDAAEQTELKDKLAEIGEVRDFSSVSPILARETVRNAGIAVGAAAVAILLYLLWAFRKMPHRFRYGVCAIIALVHDVLIVLSIFSFLSRAFHWEINPMFVTAVLAVIGYSVNDTVVVFDRIRENLTRGVSRDFGVVVNSSLSQTLTRSINTSLTTFLMVLAVYLFVGSTIQNFTLALLIGIISGTYSSIFIASQFLVVWEKGEWRRFISWLPFLSH
jgi:preprotein translocase subunit SecF